MNNNGFEALDIITILSLGLALDNNFYNKKQINNDILYEQNCKIIERLERLENNVRLNKSR